MFSPQTFLFFGPSGSGKGTQAKLLIEKLKELDSKKVLYLETGELLREFSKTGSVTAERTKEVIDNGGLMPEFLPIMLWSEFFVNNIKNGDEHIVVDGISRKLHEAWILDTAMQFYDRKHPTIISIEVSSEWATERLKERGRVDDGGEEIKRRMEWYEKSVRPALEHFKSNSLYTFVTINGEQSIEDVHKEILSKIGL